MCDYLNISVIIMHAQETVICFCGFKLNVVSIKNSCVSMCLCAAAVMVIAVEDH